MESSSEPTNSTNGTTSESSPPARNPHRRVKVYMLNNERAWDDKGTGHVSCAYIERLQGMALIVRSEDDERTVILESKICPNTTYQKQQDTLICWSENDQELALSFQLIDSCSEIWEKICDVQGRDPGDNGQDDSLHDSREDDHFEDPYSSSLLIELPSADLAHLSEIQTLFSEQTMHGGGVQWRMEKLATSIEADNYIPKLLELFAMCDDLENTEALHQLYTIFKTIFMMNKNSLFEIMFSAENLLKVVGVLEYDPSKKSPTRHREFLEKQATFHQVLPLKSESLLEKIHQTYRVQYIQDVILPTPSVFDDNVLSALTSFIFFNKCEIVKMIQDDENVMRSLFQQLTDDETDDSVRRNLIKFLKEFCLFSSSLQPSERESFFQTLTDMRVLEALETLWNLEDPEIISTTNDVFAFIADTNPSMIREFCLSEAKLGQDDLLMTKAIEQMQHDHDDEMGGAVLLSVTIKLLIDPENMLTATTTSGAPAMRTEKTEFLNYFYTHCMPVLLNPIKNLTKDLTSIKDDYRTAMLLNLTLELLAFCAEHHSYNFRIHMIKHDILRKVLYLLRSKHAFLALTVVRFVRRILSLKDETYNRHIIQGNHLKPICDAFTANGEKYNLFNSAVIELFEFIHAENVKSLINYFCETFYDNCFKDVRYVRTFGIIKEKYDSWQNTSSDGLADEHSSENMPESVKSVGKPKRFRRDNNSLEEEEEMWFDRDEDDGASGKTTPPLHTAEDLELDSDIYKSNFPKRKVKDEDDIMFTNGGPRLNRAISINLKSIMASADSPPPSPPPVVTPQSSPVISKLLNNSDVNPVNKVNLVAYEDDAESDDEAQGDNSMQETSSGSPTSKRPKLET